MTVYKTKKCCSQPNCEHELTVSYDNETGWVVTTNSKTYEKIMKKYSKEVSPITKNSYAQLKTDEPSVVRNIVSEMEK